MQKKKILNDDERNVSRYNQYQEKYGVYGAFELPGGGAFRHRTEEWISDLLNILKKSNMKN